MIYYCKGISLMKLKTMCKLYVSLLLPCPRVSSLYFCCQISPPLKLFQFLFLIFRAVGLAQLFQFQSVYLFGVHWFNKHVEKGFWQHGLGTSYSNSACFDKDDIWRYKKKKCTVHVDDDPLLHPELNFSEIRQWSHADQKNKKKERKKI